MASKNYIRNEIIDLLKGIEDDYPVCAREIVGDLIRFCLFILRYGEEVTSKEADFFANVLGITWGQSKLSEECKKLDSNEFLGRYPNGLYLLIQIDVKMSNKWDDSLTNTLLSIYHELGFLISQEDTTTKDNYDYLTSLGEIPVHKDYIESLTKYARKQLASQEGKSESSAKNKPKTHAEIDKKPAKQAEKKTEAASPKAAPQATKKAAGAVSIPTSGSTTKLDFWQAFKPYIDKLRHTEFSQVKIKDDDCLDAKPTVIVGVYNSILMRVSKKLLRLELYIDTETEKGNLQILDYIKANIKVPKALKGKIEYERKEGRRAQRVCVSFTGFELTDRSCWGKYITEIMNVADNFFDAVEAPMRELISGS